MSTICPKCGSEGGCITGTSYLDHGFDYHCGTVEHMGDIVQSDKCRIAELEARLLEADVLLQRCFTASALLKDECLRELIPPNLSKHMLTLTGTLVGDINDYLCAASRTQ